MNIHQIKPEDKMITKYLSYFFSFHPSIYFLTLYLPTMWWKEVIYILKLHLFICKKVNTW